MKKILFILLVLPTLLHAVPIDPSLAQRVAENFINAPEANASGVNKIPRKPKHMARAAMQITSDQQFYIFNSEDAEGYVIVAADNVAIPILGYSYSGTLDVNNMPENMRWWLSEYDREIKWAIAQGIGPTADTQSEWQNLSYIAKAKKADVIVAPLIQTHWSQTPRYNNLCPYDADKQKRCVTGCVATAMAQIMKYWEYPAKGIGSHSYNHSTYGEQYADFGNTTYEWSLMPTRLSSSSSNAQINAVATLMYHCGVAVEMDYGLDESGANNWWVENAYKNYFGYSGEARICAKDEYSIDEWKSKLKVQLIYGRPIYYDGRGSSGGHAFICDGYRSDDYFHFNWGWDQKDGYYSLSALKPSFLFLTTADFTSNQCALLCLHPKDNENPSFILEMENEITLRDSIPYGEGWYFMAIFSNMGDKKFDGYIYATVYDDDAAHIVHVDSMYIDSLSGVSDWLFFDLDSACHLPTGRYHVALQYRNDVGNLTWIRSDYYHNFKDVVVYNPLEIDLTAQFAWRGSREHWGVGDSITFITQINNNRSTPFTGLLTVKLVNKSDPTIYQFFDKRDCSEKTIPSHGDAIISINGKLTTTQGDYDAYVLYKNNEAEEWKLVGCTEGFVNPMSLLVESFAEGNEYVILAQRKASANWYYLTSVNVGTTSTPHLGAVSTGTADKTKVITYGLSNEYTWIMEETNGGFLLRNTNGYISYKSGNTAYMSTSSGQVLSVNNLSNGLTQYWFVDNSNATRYLSLNTTNDYFSFYKGTQAQDLLVLKCTSGPTTSIDIIEPEQTGASKVLMDGQIYILRGDKVYTITGQEVK